MPIFRVKSKKNLHGYTRGSRDKYEVCGDDGGGCGGDVNVNDDGSAARDGDLSNCNPFHLVVHYRIYKHCHAVLRQDLKTKMKRYLSPSFR